MINMNAAEKQKTMELFDNMLCNVDNLLLNEMKERLDKEIRLFENCIKEESINTKLQISFNENLSDNSIKMIKDILNDSLGFKTDIEELER